MIVNKILITMTKYYRLKRCIQREDLKSGFQEESISKIAEDLL